MNSSDYAYKVIDELSSLVRKVQVEQVERLTEEVLRAKRVFFVRLRKDSVDDEGLRNATSSPWD